MTLKGRSGGKWGVRDGLAQAYCNRRRRKRRSFAAGSGRRSKTGELARTKSAKRAGLCAAIERYDGGDSAEAFQVVVRGYSAELGAGKIRMRTDPLQYRRRKES